MLYLLLFRLSDQLQAQRIQNLLPALRYGPNATGQEPLNIGLGHADQLAQFNLSHVARLHALSDCLPYLFIHPDQVISPVDILDHILIYCKQQEGRFPRRKRSALTDSP